MTAALTTGGGDGDPINVFGDNVVDTGIGEQTAFVGYLTANANPLPFYTSDTSIEQDRQIQNRAYRPDTVLDEFASEGLSFDTLSRLGLDVGAEISVYDANSQRLFVTSGDGPQVVDCSDPADPELDTSVGNNGIIAPAADGADAIA